MKKNIILLTALFSLVACGASPLFNHDNAKNRKTKVITTTNNPRCPFSMPQVDGVDLCAKIFWRVGPALQPTDSQFDLKFWEKDVGTAEEGPYVNPGHTVYIYNWMKMPGGHEHGTSPFDIEETSEGVYRVTRVYFSMLGKWEMHLQLKDGETILKHSLQYVTLK